MTLIVRAGTPDDIAAIAAIEAQSFPRQQGVEPAWDTQALGDQLERPHTRLFVAQSPTQIIGYCLLWLVVDEAEILTLAVIPSHRRQGVGSELLEGVMNRVAAEGAHAIYLDVRETNVAGKALYERAGFIQIGERKKYYDGVENALVLKRKLAGLRVIQDSDASGVTPMEGTTPPRNGH